ncbi:MAG: DUF2249 domain-containing protein [Candidatus Izemoplasmataceae bacterium]
MKTIDATEYIPKEKHPAIMKLFFSLEVDESMLLINDHDPKPLYYQFQAEYKDTFTWEYKEEGPDIYKVVITKTKEVHHD